MIADVMFDASHVGYHKTIYDAIWMNLNLRGIMKISALLWMLLITAVVVYVVRLHGKEKALMEKLLDELKQSGFKTDHLLIGKSSLNDIGRAHRVAFDDTARQVAFIYVDTEKILKYKYDNIKEWEWQSSSKNGRHIENELIFTLRDKNRPLIKLRCVSSADAEHWMAKLDAILND